MSYVLLDHVADVKFRAEGGTLAEALGSAVDAFADITGGENLDADDTRSVEVEAENLEALLFDFLDRLIYLQEVDGVAVVGSSEVSLHEAGEELAVRAELDTATIEDETALLDIKAPTYSEMRVEESDGWTVEAVLDV